jgi:hypothetical protein
MGTLDRARREVAFGEAAHDLLERGLFLVQPEVHVRQGPS